MLAHMILLSVLIPSIPRRLPQLTALMQSLEAQADPRLEVLVYMDNCKRPLGCKRNAMIREAQGKFIANIDDDEQLSADFFTSLAPELEHDVDLVAYDAHVTLNGSHPFRVITKLGADNEQPKHLVGGRYSNILRQPWHWCCWRRELALQCKFPEYHDAAEDWTWLKQALPLVKTHRKLDKVLFTHVYVRDESTFDGVRP